MSTPMYQKAQVTSHLKTVACVQSNRCVGVHPSRMIFRAGRRDAEDREDLPITPWPHDPVVELCHRRARAPVRDAAERAAARRVATPARLAAVPVAGGPYDLRHHHHLAMYGHRHDLGSLGRRLRVVRPGLLRVRPGLLGHDDGLRLTVRRLHVRPGLLGHDDGLRLRLGLPVHRLRLHDDEAAHTYIFRGEEHGLGGRLNDCYGLGDRLNHCSLDDCSLDDMGLTLSTKFWREARRLLGLHRVGTLRPGERLVAPRPHSVPRIDLQRPRADWAGLQESCDEACARTGERECPARPPTRPLVLAP